jgi:hypothetical protein
LHRTVEISDFTLPMNMTLLPAIAISLVVSVTAFAQTSPAPSAAPTSTLPSPPPAPDAAELTKLLNDFLVGASHNDVAMHDRFWSEDLVYTASAGRRIGKADIMREVRAEAAAKKSDENTIYSAEDIRIQQYGSTAIVAFRLVARTPKGDKTEVTNYLNTGTFLKRNGKWQTVAWQATKEPGNR